MTSSGDRSRLSGPERRLQGFVSLAHSLCDMGRAGEAVDLGHWVLAQCPSFTSARIALGRALLETRQLDEAVQALASAVAEMPGSFAAHQWLAEALFERGDLDGARAALGQAATLSPENPRVSWLANQIDRRASGDTPGPGGRSRPVRSVPAMPPPAQPPQRITHEYPPFEVPGAAPQAHAPYGPDDTTPVTQPLPLTDHGPLTGRRRGRGNDVA